MSWRLGAYGRKERASQGQRRDRGPGQTPSCEDRHTPCPSRGASGRTAQGHLPARVSGFAHPASKQHERQESGPDENLPTSQDDTTASTGAWRTAWSRRPFTLHTHTSCLENSRLAHVWPRPGRVTSNDSSCSCWHLESIQIPLQTENRAARPTAKTFNTEDGKCQQGHRATEPVTSLSPSPCRHGERGACARMLRFKGKRLTGEQSVTS